MPWYTETVLGTFRSFRAVKKIFLKTGKRFPGSNSYPTKKRRVSRLQRICRKNYTENNIKVKGMR
jgi:hypothetical protein